MFFYIPPDEFETEEEGNLKATGPADWIDRQAHVTTVTAEFNEIGFVWYSIHTFTELGLEPGTYFVGVYVFPIDRTGSKRIKPPARFDTFLEATGLPSIE